MEIRGETVLLRPAAIADAGTFARILREPGVAEWWGSWDRRRVLDELLGDDESEVFAIESEGRVVGAIQLSEETDPDYRHAGLDIFLEAAAQGRGLGPDAIRTMARHAARDRGHHRITIDPAAANVRAIRAYEKVGFRPVGILRQYERTRDGQWRDGLLMDLLASELEL